MARLLRALTFLLTSFVHVSWADASPLFAPSQSPEGCARKQKVPCLISTGDRPQVVRYQEFVLELDRDTLVSIGIENQIRLHQGQLVMRAEAAVLRVFHSFAWVEMTDTKVHLKSSRERLEVRVLDGEGARVFPRGLEEPERLAPGTENWYSSPLLGEASRGVPGVIKLDVFAKERAAFFLDFELGLQSEIAKVAEHIKTQAIVLSGAYRNLVERKIASLEEQKRKLERERQKGIEFDREIRQLFIRRLSHQD